MRFLRFRRLFLVLSSCAAVPLFAVKEGDSQADVLAEKGQPRSRMTAGETVVFTYADATIKLKAGKVVSIKPAGSAADAVASSTLTLPSGQWTTNYQSALTVAKAENRKVFLFFTGSDWCGWCKKLDGEVLTKPEFKAYAGEKLILVKLDFPRQIPQSAQLKAQNRGLSQQYKIEGFPTVVVLSAEGKEVGRLGYQPGGPKAFIGELEKL
ncbi:MAG TPA: thioredoxin family protein [Opitutaceae bacterium]